jgi:hypothetical protein
MHVTKGMHLQRTNQDANPGDDLRKQHVMDFLRSCQVIEVDKPTPSMTRLFIRRDANPGFPFEQIEKHEDGGTVLIPSEWLTESFFRVIPE